VCVKERSAARFDRPDLRCAGGARQGRSHAAAQIAVIVDIATKSRFLIHIGRGFDRPRRWKGGGCFDGLREQRAALIGPGPASLTSGSIAAAAAC
jgi:hypothetical protein